MQHSLSTQPILYPKSNTRWSPDRRYRYFLRRPWHEQVTQGFADMTIMSEDRPPIAFLLLNPSTADEIKDDPTVARCRRFAVAWGYGEVLILNAFAFRATDPMDMKQASDPVGPQNDQIILESLKAVNCLGGQIVCGWGNHGKHQKRGLALRTLLAGHKGVKCFPVTKQGEPGHPLYLKNSVALCSL